MLKYDKLYQSLKKVSGDWHAGHVQWGYYWYYMKFFSDRTFIYASIDGDDFDQINTWFNINGNIAIRGKFELKGSSQLILNFDDSPGVLAEFAKDGQILVEGKLSWDIFLPID